MVKVLFVSPSLRSGGAERQLYELAAQLLRRQYDVAIVTVTEGQDVYSSQLKALGVVAYRIDSGSKFAKLRQLQHIIAVSRPNVIHGFMNIGCMYALPVSYLNKIPLIASAIRDAKNQNWKYEVCYFLLSYFSNYFVSNSKAGFATRYKRWRKNFRVIYNGMDLSRFSATPLDQIPVKEDGKRVLVMVASLSAHKDHETLLHALTSSRLKQYQIQLNLVGDEPPTESGNRRKLEERVEQLGLADRVSFLGYQADVENHIRAADISILLTNSGVHLEGLSNSIAESMALCKPVIATNTGGTPELVDDGETGFLVPNGDPDAVAAAIQHLLDNPERGASLGHNGHEKIVGGFSVERMADDYIALYDQACSISSACKEIQTKPW